MALVEGVVAESRPDIPPLLKIVSVLSEAWCERAELFGEHGVTEVFFTYRKCAEELDRKIRTACLHTLTLKEAAEESGYSPDHLRRLIREGKLQNAGMQGSPRVFLKDISSKPVPIQGGPLSVRGSSEDVILEVIEGGLKDE